MSDSESSPVKPGQISGKKAIILLYAAVIPTLAAVVASAYSFGRPSDDPLPVTVTLEKRSVPVPDGSGALLTDVVVVHNDSDEPIPNLDISINKQYFLYRNSALDPGEEFVVPQAIFSTKSNQRYNPQRYPPTKVIVTGKLPSGGRGVHKMKIDLPEAEH